MRVLAPALRRHRRRRALEDLEQRLLHALAGHVARDRRVLALAGDLVDLVDVDDARLGLLDVVVGGLDELEQDVLDVLADVAGLGQRGRVRDRERDVEHLRQRLRQVRLAAAGRADQQDVRLGDLDAVVLGAGQPAGLAGLDALVVVVDGDREGPLGRLLADDVLLEEVEDLLRLRQLDHGDLGGLGELLLDDLVAEIDALVADVDTWSGDELLDLLLGLAAEGALEEVGPVPDASHCRPLSVVRPPARRTGPSRAVRPEPAAPLHCTPRAPPCQQQHPLATGRFRRRPVASSSRSGRGRGDGHRGRGLAALEHLVDQAVLQRLRGGEDLVALDVVADLVHGAPAVEARGSPRATRACG